MTYSIIYIFLLGIAITILIINKNWPIRLKTPLIKWHLVALLLLFIDLILVTQLDSSLRGVWTDSLLVIALFISGAVIFALYRKTLSTWTKTYFGFYLFYPVVAALTFLIDRIMFVIVASPLIVPLMQPDQYYSDNKYDIRSSTGIMAPKQVELIEKSLLTEKRIGRAEDGYYGNEHYKSISILSQSADSIVVVANIEGQEKEIIFKK